MSEMIQFEHPREQSNIIKVIGVGGGGSNAVTHMYEQGIKGVDFALCNTDMQALDTSPVPNKIYLGKRQLGAGNFPSVGREAAMESTDEIKTLLEKHTKMLFITAGMGGGTGTGAAPVVAQIARELDILTVGIVTLPFGFEGRKRREQAQEGIEELKKHVDTLLVISNDKLREEYGNMKLTEAFKKVDDVLATAAKGIAEIITVTGYVNVDFEDVKTVMKGSGTAIMGSAVAEGSNRALQAIQDAMRSPLLNDSEIAGAKNILLYITAGKDDILLDEVLDITDHIQLVCGNSADVIWGKGQDERLGEKIAITLIATGFSHDHQAQINQKRTVKVTPLYDQGATPSNTIITLADTVNEPQQNDPFDQETSDMETPIQFEWETTDQALQPEIRQIKETPDLFDQLPVSQEYGEDPKLTDQIEDEIRIIQKNPEPNQPADFDTIFKKLKSTDHIEPKSQEIEAIKQTTQKLDAARKKQLKNSKLHGLSMLSNTPDGLLELEQTPAYKRKGIQLDNEDEQNISSRYSIDGSSGLKSENTFLHDNVD